MKKTIYVLHGMWYSQYTDQSIVIDVSTDESWLLKKLRKITDNKARDYLEMYGYIQEEKDEKNYEVTNGYGKHAEFHITEHQVDMQWMAEYQDDEAGPEISRTLTISTAHISQGTARLIDMDAINIGFYSRGESGYHITTVGWEEYQDEMPGDMKACVKFAAEHGCDWLCLDADGPVVHGLPTYQWE